MKKLAPSVTHSDPKGRKFLSVVADAYDNACLAPKEAQRVNETRGLSRLIEEFIRANRSNVGFSFYACEEVSSNHTYPRAYTGPTPIKDQITALAEMFDLDPTHALTHVENLPDLPVGAEGWFAFLSDTGLEKLFSQTTDNAGRYYAGVRLVLEKIDDACQFFFTPDDFTPDRLRLCGRTEHARHVLAEQQPGDILVVAAQLGMRHRGRSSRWARECFGRNEFGLDILGVGCVILTNPSRFTHGRGWLDIICLGNESASNDSRGIPYFQVDDDTCEKSYLLLAVDCAVLEGTGQVTGFIT